jgi:glycosyltransferase involved in cell wall biosynthesis
MNILILNWRDPKHPLSGGAELSLLEHAKVWQKKGAQITWFASNFKGAKSLEVIDGITYLRQGNHFTVHFHFLISYIFHRTSHNYDVIVDCFHFFPYFTPIYIKNKKIIALINEVAGEVWFENLVYPLAFIGYKLEPFIIRLYKKVPFITGSESAKKDLISVGIRKDMITVINHGFTKLKFNGKAPQKEENPTLMFLGRLSKDKGVEDALMMLELLMRDDKAIKLWVVGKFENKNYEKRVKNLIEQFRVKNNCIFYGYVSDEKKAELLARAWLLVHPSTKEGWGLNVIEANSVGTPAVGYNVQGLSDSIVDGKTGMLVDTDPISLADGVEKILGSKKELLKLSNNAIAWSQKFSWEKAGEESWKLIQEN